MRLSSTTGFFQLSIMGYGIDPTNWRERNRLHCQVATRWFRKHDVKPAPIQTWEVNRMIDNLQSLWSRLTNHVTITFAEPGLSLEAIALSDDHYRVNIQLDHTLAPVWHHYPDFPLEISMQLNRLQLQEAIHDLSSQLANYPER